jgi:hypothetical protein
VVKAAVEKNTISGLTQIGDKTALKTMILSLPLDSIKKDDVTA